MQKLFANGAHPSHVGRCVAVILIGTADGIKVYRRREFNLGVEAVEWGRYYEDRAISLKPRPSFAGTMYFDAMEEIPADAKIIEQMRKAYEQSRERDRLGL